MKNALVYMTFLFLLTGMLSGCTETMEAPTEEAATGGNSIEMKFEVAEPAKEEVDVSVEVEAEEAAEETPVEAAPEEERVEEEVEITPEEETVEETSSNTYVNGSYSRTGAYNSPAGAESLTVSLTLKDDVIVDARVFPASPNNVSLKHQEQFAAAVPSLVNGTRLDELSGISAVNGASLTGAGFNQAVAAIKSAAKS